MRDPSDPDFLARVGTGDQEALQELYENYAERLRRFIVGKYGRLGITYQDAEETANDAFVEFHMAAVNFHPEKGSLSTFIFNLARRNAVDLVRKRLRTRKADALDVASRSEISSDDLTYKDRYPQMGAAMTDPERALEQAEEYARLWTAMSKLSPMERDILLHARIMKDEDLARRYNTTVNNIRVTRHRAVGKVRVELGRAKK